MVFIKKMSILVWIISCATQLGHVEATYTTSDAYTLYNAVKTNYRTTDRPEATTEITIGLGLSAITKLDIIDQQLHATGFLLIQWTDPRLSWDASLYGGLDELNVKASEIWVPPIMVNNAAAGYAVMSDDSNLASVPLIVIGSAQSVAWLAPTTFVSQCTINIKYYPFDKQQCDVHISSWLYSSSQLNIVSDSQFPVVNTDLYEENGEWDLEDSSTVTTTRTLLNQELPIITFSLKLKRKYSYYLLNMIMPVVFLAVLGAFVFALPVESGEKVGFTLTILLSLSVVLGLVSDKIPPTSTNTCILIVLGVYLVVTYIVCTLEVVLTVYTIKVYNLDDLGYTPSNRLQKFTKHFLVKIARYRRSMDLKDDNTRMDDMDKETVEVSEKVANHYSISQAWKNSDKATGDSDKEVAYNYKDISIMMDRVNFVIFLLSTIIITFVFLIILTVEGGNQEYGS